MFDAPVALLEIFLERRTDIVDQIERSLLNVRGKEPSRRTDRPFFEHLLNTCFFGLPGLPSDLVRLRGQLAARHVADGFEPMNLEANANHLDPLLLVARAYHHWEYHHWPGRSGRLTYAESIYAVFLLREFEYLCLRIWDEGPDAAPGKLARIQQMLGQLNASPAPGAFVGDARWLIQTAQGPVTKYLEPYFDTADRVTESFDTNSRLEIHRAGTVLAGGHLRSQLRYRMARTGRPIGDPENLAITRNSNAMDGALLVGDLVALLRAYKIAISVGDSAAKTRLADAICQGLSADPDLLVTRLDLLAPNLMIEDVFVERAADGHARHSPRGERYQGLIADYSALIGELSAGLRDEAGTVNPEGRAYSPYAISYGFVTDLLWNMAQDALHGRPTYGLTLEDMFESHTRLDEKRSRANGWANLPKLSGEQDHFTHDDAWARDTFDQLIAALDLRAKRPDAPNASDRRSGRLFVVPEGTPPDQVASAPADAVRADEHCLTSDLPRALAGTWTGAPRAEMSADRKEGRYLSSVERDGRWFAVSKVVLTLVIGPGNDALITNVPAEVLEGLGLACPDQLYPVVTPR